MTATVLFQTDYANGKTPAPPWGYQCPPGKITVHAAADTIPYQRHENDPGVNWNGMQRADALQNTPTPLHDGDEIAFKWMQCLEPGFYAPNPGWCVVGPEIHDSRGSTQSPLELLTSQDGVQVRVFGGAISTIPPGQPVFAADKFYSPTFPFMAGVWHACELGIIFSADRTKGRVRYMVDGDLHVDQPCATIYAGSTAYLKQAFYRDPNQAGNKVAAVRFGDLTVWTGSGSWEAATGTPTPPPPVSRPIHDAVALVSAKDDPNIRHAFDLIADKIEP